MTLPLYATSSHAPVMRRPTESSPVSTMPELDANNAPSMTVAVVSPKRSVTLPADRSMPIESSPTVTWPSLRSVAL